MFFNENGRKGLRGKNVYIYAKKFRLHEMENICIYFKNIYVKKERQTTKTIRTKILKKKNDVPLLPTPGAPTTAIFKSVSVDFLRLMPRVVII